jgi:hypothetical protein
MHTAYALTVSPLPPLDDKVKPVAVEWAADGVRAWAASRGLDHTPLGMLPGLTPALAAGHGAGDHRATVVTRETFNARGGHTRESRGGWTRRPERTFANLCAGTLPGGEPGVLAHVTSMETVDDADGDHWGCVTRTVAVVRVPEARRVVRELTGRPGAGWSWTPRPAEDPATLAAATAPAAEALGALPHPAHVEVHDGTVAVVARPAIADPARLDAMARAASLLARGLRETAAALPEREPGETWPAATDPETAEGAARLAWEAPPASLAAAREAYARPARRPGRKLGRGLGKVAAGLTWLTPLPVDGPGGPSQDARDRTRANLWALTAFTATYAARRGLEEIDRDELRRRLPDAPAGVPLRALHGTIAPGVRGVLALWIDKTDLTAEPGYGIYARTDDGGTAWAVATPETIMPERLDEVARSAARASAPALV